MAAFFGIPAYKLASNAAMGVAGLTGGVMGDNLLGYHQYLNRERLEKNRLAQNEMLKAQSAQMYAQPDRANLAQMQQQLVAQQNLAANTGMQVPGEAFNEWRNRIWQAEMAKQGNGGAPTSFQQYQQQYK